MSRRRADQPASSALDIAPKQPIRVATRASRLALAQTEQAIELLRRQVPNRVVETVPMQSEADERPAESLRTFGDKGAFVSAIERLLIDGRADVAVHSLKDVPLTLPRGLWLAAFLPREDPRDIIVSGDGGPLASVAEGARVATSSLRRVEQLRAQRPDLQFLDIRGNVQTRIAKMRAGFCDAIVLAAAGLHRLGLESEIAEYIPFEICTPAPGQGIVVFECRENYELGEELSHVSDEEAGLAARAERAVAEGVGATCMTAFGALATINGSSLELMAFLHRDGRGRRASATAPRAEWSVAAKQVVKGLGGSPAS